jgi:hypothetical protein
MKPYTYTICAIMLQLDHCNYCAITLQLLCHYIVTTLQLHTQQRVDMTMLC